MVSYQKEGKIISCFPNLKSDGAMIDEEELAIILINWSESDNVWHLTRNLPQYNNEGDWVSVSPIVCHLSLSISARPIMQQEIITLALAWPGPTKESMLIVKITCWWNLVSMSLNISFIADTDMNWTLVQISRSTYLAIIPLSEESVPDVMRISIHSKRVLLRLSEGTLAGETGGWAGVDTGTQRPRLVAISEWSRERSHGQIWVRVSLLGSLSQFWVSVLLGPPQCQCPRCHPASGRWGHRSWWCRPPGWRVGNKIHIQSCNKNVIYDPDFLTKNIHSSYRHEQFSWPIWN